ncbi:MAG TPA: NAD(P)/FAD-dependent oxidoreductase [Steroidobacteraceae bacterium]|nr:NAD(P)/FAD-dependent oxidoreductase [Steroidobacteraceae bacterium]
MTATAFDSDVLVVGGGPAGSTMATLLARKGLSVALLERDRHPRFHIGESLLPMNMPILDRLGLLAPLAAIGVKKLGADFPADNERGYNVFRFERCLNPTWPFAYQVRRDEFDRMLFEHAAANGARVEQDARVGRITFRPDGAIAEVSTADGATRTHRTRYVVDATGRDTLLGTQLRLKKRNPAHQSAALFAHFRGVERRPGEDAGNVSVYRFEHGWVWMIPLRDGCVSVGAVCSPEYLKRRDVPRDQLLLQTLRDLPDVWKRMARAEIVGNLHATGNYSYTCTRMSGRGWLMVGDAYAFVDPIFSTGVYLAMYTAELGAEVVAGALANPARERALQRRYEREVRAGLSLLSWFIFRFTTPAMTYLFRNPRNMFRIEEAMISLLAGDVFRDGGVRWRLRLFKLLYAITSVVQLRDSVASFFKRRRQAAVSFTGGTTRQDSA